MSAAEIATDDGKRLAYYGGTAGREFLRSQALWLLGAAALILAVFGTTDVDRSLTRVFFDTARGVFPLTNDWWLKVVLHDAARAASAIGALGILAACCLAWSTRWPPLHARRRELAFASAALFGAAAIVGTLKHFSAHACPWDVAGFGGSVPYLHGLARSAKIAAVQGCLPAAHPLTGYAWLCIGFLLYPASAARARAAWLAAAALGTLFGLVQVARGAHFLSHVLWSAWIVWAVDVGLVAAWSAALRPAAQTRTTRLAESA